MISPRYVPHICVLLALALLPTVMHSYVGAVTSDGRVTTRIPASLLEYTARDSTRNSTWGKRRFNSDDWIERTYVNAGQDEVTLTVVRSYDAKSLYHHPELAVAYGTNFKAVLSRRLSPQPHIPVHVLTPGPGVHAQGMYVLHYDGRFIEDPMMFQIRTAAELLFRARKPMTLFFILDPSVREGTDLERSGATRVLFAAIESFLEQKASLPLESH